MNSVFSVSFFAVLKLLLGVLVGCILGKTGIMPADARRSLSKIILWVMLPCMLITSLCKNISIDNVRQYTWVTLSAGIIALAGFLLAQVLSRLFKVKDEQFRPCVAASCLGNASYIPLPLLGTICFTAPIFSDNPNSIKELSVLYVSVFLMLHSPLLWLFGFPYLSGKSIREIKLKQLLSPPICASFIGLKIIGRIDYNPTVICVQRRLVSHANKQTIFSTFCKRVRGTIILFAHSDPHSVTCCHDDVISSRHFNVSCRFKLNEFLVSRE